MIASILRVFKTRGLDERFLSLWATKSVGGDWIEARYELTTHGR